MKFGSLFSGVGGFDLGFEQAGLSCSWQVEIDKDCQRVLSRHWPGVKRYEDVSTIGKLESVDVICGGFPCQDLSVAGKRAGLAGERSGLWFEFLRIIGLNRPRWIVIENVPGLLSSDWHRDFAAILRGLVECGYSLAWRVLDAQFYGVAQRRRRVFIVGSLGDGSCAQILFESESVSWNPPTRAEARAGVANAVTTGTGKSSGPRNGNGQPLHLIAPEISPALTSVTHALRSEGADASEDGTGRGTPLVAAPITSSFAKHHGRTAGNNGGADNLVVNCFNGYTGGPDDNDAQANHLIAFSSKDHGADAGEMAPTLRSQNFKDSHINGGGQVAIAFTERGREGGANLEAQEELSYALRDPQKGMNSRNAILGNFGVRRLTPRECERLQGFPDDWTLYDANGKEISDSARYRMLGNAIAVPVARFIGSRARNVFSISDR